jgi:hypothetical protein
MLVAVSLLGLFAPSPAGAQPPPPLVVTPPGPISVIEGVPDFQMTFNVLNNTNQVLILDYALAIITPGPPDPLDKLSFSGANGANGLVSAPIELLPGATGNFIYSVQAPDDGAPDVDFGRNRFSFFIEMSPFTGSVLPPPNTTISSGGFLVFLDLSAVGTAPNPANLAQLQAFQPLAPGVLLYPNGIQGTPYPATTIVQVNDTPEPSSLVLVATGALALLGYAGRRQRASKPPRSR